MAKKYKIYRSEDHYLRKQISEGLDSLSERVGGPDNPDGPPVYDGINARWRGEWVQQQYYQGDMVTDGLWLCIANKDTTDRPAPQPIGSPIWTISDTPTWSTTPQYTGNVFSGLKLTVPSDYMYAVTGVRTWVEDFGDANAQYRTVVINNITGDLFVGREFNAGNVVAAQWVENLSTPELVFEGEEFSFILQQWNSAADTNYDFKYVFIGLNQIDVDPGPGNWSRNNQHTTIRLNQVDDDAVDRTVQLLEVIPGTKLRIEETATPALYADYDIITSTQELGGWFQFTVLLAGQGSALPRVGETCQVKLSIPTPVPTTYVTLTDGYLNNPGLQGYFNFDELLGGALDNNAYGIDIQIQAYSESPDWDIMALSSTQFSSTGGPQTLSASRLLAPSATTRAYDVTYSDFIGRFTATELENWAKLNNRTVVVPGPPPTWDEVAHGIRFMGYTTVAVINLRDPVVWLGVNWLESMGVIGPGRAAIILAI